MRKGGLWALLAVLLLACCTGPATGPVNGVLLVFDPMVDPDLVDQLVDDVQVHVMTVEDESAFIFTSCTLEDFTGDLRTRRSILFAVSDREDIPAELTETDGIWLGTDLWAEGQDLFGVVLPGSFDATELSRLMEDSYQEHLTSYLYGSFVATQMSSPERVDSLLALGFSMDIPKSYRLENWRPETGLIQYQRIVSDDCLLILTVRWLEDGRRLSEEEAVLWRESVARNFLYDAGADSVDRSRVQSEPLELHGVDGMRLLGMWRNPEHLNAGAFTSYILYVGETRFLLDLEVFHEHREKEPYIREGWIIMNTFVPGS